MGVRSGSYKALAGYDPKDSFSAKVRVPNYRGAVKSAHVKGIRIGIPKEYYFEVSSKEVTECVMRAIHALEGLGATVVEVSIPSARYAVDAGAIISWSEAATIHEEFLRARPGEYGEEVRALLQLASTHLATHYIKAQRARAVMMKECADAFGHVDVIITPTSPIPPPRMEEKTFLQVSLLTRIACLTGEPALSVPCGFTSTGLPIGAHIQAKRFNEATIYRVAHVYEQSTEWHLQQPPVP